jgi:dolichol-phosphate mannosyltransferase
MIFFLIPIFNEEKNIPNLFKELDGILPAEEKFFVFSDDGSTDNTVSELKKYFSAIPHVVLGDGKNRGPGAAFNCGFEWILANQKTEKDLVVTLEADCTSDITIVDKMISINRLGYDLVLASVYAQGGGFDKTTFLRKFISSVANLMYRFLFNINVLTLSSFYRVYTIAILKKLRDKYSVLIKEPGFICMLEILVKAVDTRASIIEVPMVLSSKKRIGRSKMKMLKTTYQYFVFLLSTRRKYS